MSEWAESAALSSPKWVRGPTSSASRQGTCAAQLGCTSAQKMEPDTPQGESSPGRQQGKGCPSAAPRPSQGETACSLDPQDKQLHNDSRQTLGHMDPADKTAPQPPPWPSLTSLSSEPTLVRVARTFSLQSLQRTQRTTALGRTPAARQPSFSCPHQRWRRGGRSSIRPSQPKVPGSHDCPWPRPNPHGACAANLSCPHRRWRQGGRGPQHINAQRKYAAGTTALSPAPQGP